MRKYLCSVWAWSLSGIYPRTGLYGSSNFSIFRGPPYSFHRGWTNLCSQQKCIKIPFSPPPHCNVCLVIAVLTMVSWTLNVVLVLYRYIRAVCVVVGAREKRGSLEERK